MSNRCGTGRLLLVSSVSVWDLWAELVPDELKDGGKEEED